MQRGRALSTGDMQRDERSQVAVISDRYWNTALARSEQAVGETIDLKGVRLTIVGVAAPDSWAFAPTRSPTSGCR